MTTIEEVHWHKSNLTAGTHKQVRYEVLKQALEDNFSFLPMNCAKKKLQATNDVQKTSCALLEYRTHCTPFDLDQTSHLDSIRIVTMM